MFILCRKRASRQAVSTFGIAFGKRSNAGMISSVSTPLPNKGIYTLKNSDLPNYILLTVKIRFDHDIESDLTALVGSGSFTNCIDRATTIALGIPILQKPVPLMAETIDGRNISITEETSPLHLLINGSSQTIQFDVITSPHYPIILGTPWLKKNNPCVNWRTMSIEDHNTLNTNNLKSLMNMSIADDSNQHPYFNLATSNWKSKQKLALWHQRNGTS